MVYYVAASISDSTFDRTTSVLASIIHQT